MRYQLDVFETRSVQVRYTVEADSREEALEMADIGETEDEQVIQEHGVLNREVVASSLTGLPDDEEDDDEEDDDDDEQG